MLKPPDDSSRFGSLLYGPDDKPLAPSRSLPPPLPEQEHPHKQEPSPDKQHYSVQPTIGSGIEFPPHPPGGKQAEYNKAYRLQKREAAIATIHLKIQRRIACAAWCAFVAASIYAAITFGQWYDLRHNFEVDQRSILKLIPTAKLQHQWQTLDDINGLYYAIDMSNIGKVPARDIRIFCVVTVVAKDSAPTLQFRVEDGFMFETRSILFPGPSEDALECLMTSDQKASRNLPPKSAMIFWLDVLIWPPSLGSPTEIISGSTGRNSARGRPFEMAVVAPIALGHALTITT
jgi:hypothetical protein